MKNTLSVNAWTFAPDAVTVNGCTFPAQYSLARTGDVYVFASVKAAADAAEMPVRLHISAAMPMHAEAVAAAEAARKTSKAAAQADKPASVQDAPAPVQEAPAPVQDAPVPVDKPTPAKKASKPRKASKTAEIVAPAVEAQPAPVQDAPASKPAVAEKAWIGTTLTGKGWTIAFDQAAGRTRVQVEGTPTDAQRSAIEQAGFYWSAQLQSWNKKLTCKAYRAAQNLANTLNALA